MDTYCKEKNGTCQSKRGTLGVFEKVEELYPLSLPVMFIVLLHACMYIVECNLKDL